MIVAATTKPKQRRARGDHSIYFDESRGANGTWVGEISLGVSASGRRLRRKVYGDSPSAVRSELRRVAKEAESGVKTLATYTVGDAVEKWLNSAQVTKLAPTTQDKLRRLANYHVLPQIGKVKLRSLAADDVEEWLAERGTELTTSTLQEVFPILRRSIKLAQRANLVPNNVCELVTIPKGRDGRPRRSFTVDQAVAVLAAAMAFKLYAYIVVSLMNGIRTEEARALKWDRVHLDPKNGRPPHIEVYRSARIGEDTKTKKSRRALELPPEAVVALREQQGRQAEWRRTAGVAWVETGHVFTSELGTQLDAANVRRQFRRVLVAAGVAGHVGVAFRELRIAASLTQAAAVAGLRAGNPNSTWVKSKLNGIETGRLQIPEAALEALLAFYDVDDHRAEQLRAEWRTDCWTPQELRHSFVSIMSFAGVDIEDIARMAGHSSSRVTQSVYRHELQEVITGGASAMSSALTQLRQEPGAVGSRAG